MAFLEDTPEAIVIQLLISDGNADRKHRSNLFREDFKVIGLSHQTLATNTEFKCVTVINYAHKFLKEDEDDPIKIAMDKFLHEEVTFNEEKANGNENMQSWKQKAKISVKGMSATKETIKTVKWKDGTTEEFKKEDKKELEI